jgi:virginiamycin A acetyltransferase
VKEILTADFADFTNKHTVTHPYHPRNPRSENCDWKYNCIPNAPHAIPFQPDRRYSASIAGVPFRLSRLNDLLKSLANLIAEILVLPLVVGFHVACLLLTTERAFPGFSQLVSLLPGITGVYLRRAFYQFVLPSCGSDSWISFGTVFSHSAASVGRHTYVGVGCMLGDVTLEDDVLLGSHVSIINGNRQHGIERLDIPIREQPGAYPRVTIGRDTWIGDRSIVMANVGKQCVIGAGSVVTKPIPDFAVAFGNPARVVGYRVETTDSNTGAISDVDIVTRNPDLAERETE